MLGVIYFTQKVINHQQELHVSSQLGLKNTPTASLQKEKTFYNVSSDSRAPTLQFEDVEYLSIDIVPRPILPERLQLIGSSYQLVK